MAFLFPTKPGAQQSKAESAEMPRMVLDAAGFQTSNFVDEHGRSRLICGASREGGRRGDHTASRQMGVDDVQQAPLAVAAGVLAQALGVRLHDAGPPPSTGASGTAGFGRRTGPPRYRQSTLAAAEPNVEFVPPPARVPVDRAIDGTTPTSIMNCRTRLVDKPAADEDGPPQSEPTGRPSAGGRIGVRQFFRLDALPPGQKLFDSSSSSSSSTSGRTSDSD
eukprot:s3266_g10.t1